MDGFNNLMWDGVEWLRRSMDRYGTALNGLRFRRSNNLVRMFVCVLKVDVEDALRYYNKVCLAPMREGL